MTGRIEGLNSEMEEKVCVSSYTLWVSDDSENQRWRGQAICFRCVASNQILLEYFSTLLSLGTEER